MKTERIQIDTIPAVLYGESAKQGYLFLHGQMGRKEEAEAFAQVVCPKGFQVLSIDLPGHGERQDRGEELTPWPRCRTFGGAGLGRPPLEHSLAPGQQHRGLLCYAGR